MLAAACLRVQRLASAVFRLRVCESCVEHGTLGDETISVLFPLFHTLGPYFLQLRRQRNLGRAGHVRRRPAEAMLQTDTLSLELIHSAPLIQPG